MTLKLTLRNDIQNLSTDVQVSNVSMDFVTNQIVFMVDGTLTQAEIDALSDLLDQVVYTDCYLSIGLRTGYESGIYIDDIDYTISDTEITLTGDRMRCA